MVFGQIPPMKRNGDFAQGIARIPCETAFSLSRTGPEPWT